MGASKTFLMFLLAVMLCFNAKGNSWHEGVVILDKGSKIEGEIKWDFSRDIIQVKVDGVVKAFTSYSVASFQFYDSRLNLIRTFNSEVLPSKYTLARKTFYEVVLSGDIELLRKEKLKWDVPGNSKAIQQWVADDHSEVQVDYEYFVKLDNRVERISSFQKQIVPLMKDQAVEINNFIDRNDFDIKNPLSHILIINYYNHLKNNKRTFSMSNWRF